jgi:hypothetical protein
MSLRTVYTVRFSVSVIVIRKHTVVILNLPEPWFFVSVGCYLYSDGLCKKRGK